GHEKAENAEHLAEFAEDASGYARPRTCRVRLHAGGALGYQLSTKATGDSAAGITTHASIGANHPMVDKNDPLLRELGEEMRREQLQKLWEQYGTYILGVAALVVAVVGGFKAWEARQKSVAEASGAQYEAAAELAGTGKVDAAE